MLLPLEALEPVQYPWEEEQRQERLQEEQLAGQRSRLLPEVLRPKERMEEDPEGVGGLFWDH